MLEVSKNKSNCAFEKQNKFLLLLLPSHQRFLFQYLLSIRFNALLIIKSHLDVRDAFERELNGEAKEKNVSAFEMRLLIDSVAVSFLSF